MNMNADTGEALDTDPLEDRDILLEVIRGLVVSSEKVSVDEQERGDETFFTIFVDPKEVGIVIGRDGETIRALKHIMRGIANRDGRKVYIRVEPGPAVYRRARHNEFAA
jgi:predicted RNA-binding protein YlqC (UPF0109 family)